MKCPHCGKRIRETYTFESSSRKLPNVAAVVSPPTGPPPGFSARRETPAYLPSRETHLDLPLSQAYAFARFVAPIGLVIGSVGGLVVAAITDVVMAGARDANLTGWGYIGIIGLFGVGGAIVAFFWEARGKFPERLDFYDSLLWKTEEATQLDLDGDGHIGQPEPKEPEVVKVEFTENGIPRQISEIAGIGVDRLKNLAELVRGGRGFSERTAGEAKISQKEFGRLRDQFIKEGWAKWKNDEPRQGVQLLRKGASLFAVLSPTLSVAVDGSESNGVDASSKQQAGSGDNLYQRFEHIEE